MLSPESEETMAVNVALSGAEEEDKIPMSRRLWNDVYSGVKQCLMADRAHAQK